MPLAISSMIHGGSNHRSGPGLRLEKPEPSPMRIAISTMKIRYLGKKRGPACRDPERTFGTSIVNGSLPRSGAPHPEK